MFTFIIFPTIIIVVVVSIFLRLFVRSVWNPYGIRRPYYGPFGYYGHRRHRLGWFLPVMLLVAIDRIFGRRW